MDNKLDEFLLNKLEKLDEKLDKITEQNKDTRAALQSHELRDEQIHDEVKKMGNQLSSQSQLLAEYNESLREHIRRTELLEKRQDQTDAKVNPLHKEREERLILEQHKSNTWKKRAAVLGIIATIVGIVAALVELL